MGCDGGTIPTRDELVRLKKKPEQKDKTADLAAKWKHCAITQEQLREPIMACELGRLYNKEAVLEFLIDRSKFECASSFGHLRGLKDVKQLGLTRNKSFSQPQSEKGDGYIDRQDSLYICPVVGLEMNGMYKFSFLWGCGCVLSERALKEVKGTQCHKCGKPFTSDDAVVLNGTEDDLERMVAHMDDRRLQQKLQKKTKKASKQKCETATSSSADGPSTSKQAKLSQPETDSQLTNDVKGSKVVDNAKTRLTNGVKGSKVVDNGKTRLANGSKLRGVSGIADEVKKGGSIQKDPKASTAYKALFTSSARAKNQPSAHWVTSNPYWM